MIEFFRHVLGFCGEHWHPNIWTAAASSPIIASTIYYVKSKCGGMFKHNKGCEEVQHKIYHL